MIRDNPGFQYLLISRKRALCSYITLLILSICIPLTVVVSIAATTKTKTNPMEVELENCAVMPCVDLAIAPKNNSLVDKFVENYVKEFGLKDPVINIFDNADSLMDFVNNTGLGQARSAIYLGD